MSRLTPLVGLGAGGHAKTVIDILRLSGGYEFIGLVTTDETLWGTKVLGIPVIGGDEKLPELIGEKTKHAFIGVGTVGDSSVRIRLYERLLDLGFQIVSAVHPSSVIAGSAIIGNGPTIGPGALVNAEAWIGDDVIINSGAIVEHDCIVGNHTHVASGACLAGAARIGEKCLIGMGSSVREGIYVGSRSIVGAGAVVVRDVPEGVVVVGVPARVKRRI